jgi:hypothetical protein
VRAGRRAVSRPRSGSRRQANDLVPGGEAGGHFVSVGARGEAVAAGRKCGDIPLNVERNRCACPAEVKPFIARSRCLVGWWESDSGGRVAA